MRGKTNKKLPRELPRMHLSVRCDAHVLSLLVSPPFRLSFSLSFLSFSFLRANRCTRRVPTSCPSPVVYPLPRLAFNSASPRPPPLSTPYFSPATPPNPVTLLPRSLSFSPFLSLSLSLSPRQPTTHSTPPPWVVVHLACTCCVNAQPAASARSAGATRISGCCWYFFYRNEGNGGACAMRFERDRITTRDS